MGYFGIPFRNGVPIGLGSVASFGAQQFDPSSLFIGGTVGTFYDPSDPTTLFTTSTGTTPCAVPGSGSQVLVGLMLDKSQGAPGALGAELFGTFGTVTAPWTAQGGGAWSIDGSQAGSRDLSQALQYTIGRFYVTRFTLSGVTGGSVNVFAGEGAVGPAYGNGTFTIRSYSSQAYLIFRAPAGVAATVSGISVREIPGNHAIAFNDTTARPELSARVNQLLNTDGYSGAIITPATGLVVVSTGLPDPQGGNTARQIRNTTTTEQHRLFTSVSFSGRPLYSVQVKNVDAGFIQLSIAGTVVAAFGATFDLTTKNVTLVSSGAMPTATIEDLNNGYLRCAVLAPATETGCANIQLYILEADASTVNPSTTGTNKSVIVAGADLRPANIGSAIPAYQRIADQYTYDSNGFPSYLRFDGVDDSMYTPASIPFATVTSDGLARRNLLSNPTQFDAAGWTKNVPPYPLVTANTDIAPDGTMTMDTITGESGLTRYLQQTVSVSASTTYAVSIYVKSGTSTRSVLRVADAGVTTILAGLNIDWSGSVPSVGATSGTWVTGPTITAAENGTYRVVGAFSSGANTSVAYLFYPDNSFIGSGNVKSWGAQLETGSTATAFQNIGTDKMSVFAGVRKLSDAASAILAELSASAGANNGSFYFAAPTAALPDFGFLNRGTAAQLITASPYAAPVTVVASGIGDIAGAVSAIRINGSQVGINTTSQGTGNYGTYPLYIGARNNSSLWFNGHLYSLIIAGSAVSAGNISATEQWVAGKTGIVIP